MGEKRKIIENRKQKNTQKLTRAVDRNQNILFSRVTCVHKGLGSVPVWEVRYAEPDLMFHYLHIIRRHVYKITHRYCSVKPACKLIF